MLNLLFLLRQRFSSQRLALEKMNMKINSLIARKERIQARRDSIKSLQSLE